MGNEPLRKAITSIGSDEKTQRCNFGRYAAVFAHPDGDVLWASSLLTGAERIVLCLGASRKPKVASARDRALKSFPLPTLTLLNIPESGAFDHGDWPLPRETPYCVEILDYRRRNPLRES